MTRFKFRRLINRPSLHQDWGQAQAERKVTWTELFFDLFYVVSSAQATHMIVDYPDSYGAGWFMLYYSAFWWVWSSHSLFLTRFKLEGFMWDLLHLSYMLGVLGMIVHADYPSNYARFAVGFIIVRVCYILMHLSMFLQVERARASSGVAMALYSCTTALALTSSFLTKDAFVAIFIILLILEFTIPFAGALHPAARVPLHVDHTAERIGLIMMIYLGECVGVILFQPVAKTAAQYVGLALAAAVIWCLHLVYYHTSPEPDDHALRIKAWRGIAWNYLHWALGASFLITGAGMKLILKAYLAKEDGGTGGVVKTYAAWILCVGYGASLHLMALVRAAHWVRFDFGNEDNVYAIGAKAGILRLLVAWWALVFLWPVPAYFIPFGKEQLGVTGVLACLALHGLVMNFLETAITHTVEVQPGWRQYVAAEAAAHAGRKHKRAAGGGKSGHSGHEGGSGVGGSDDTADVV